jgi:hypothetical protein
MAKRTLPGIMQRGLISFAVCGRCHAQFESKCLNLSKARVEIQAKYDEHRCKSEDPSPADVLIVVNRRGG